MLKFRIVRRGMVALGLLGSFTACDGVKWGWEGDGWNLPTRLVGPRCVAPGSLQQVQFSYPFVCPLDTACGYTLTTVNTTLGGPGDLDLVVVAPSSLSVKAHDRVTSNVILQPVYPVQRSGQQHIQVLLTQGNCPSAASRGCASVAIADVYTNWPSGITCPTL